MPITPRLTDLTDVKSDTLTVGTAVGVDADGEFVGLEFDSKGTAQGLIEDLELGERFAEKVDVDDPRLSDSRDPNPHTHSMVDVVDLPETLDVKADLIGGTIPSSQLPALVKTDVYTVNNESAMLALDAQSGDIAIRTDLTKTFVHNGGTSGTVSDWSELISPTDAVTSVNGLIGAVTLGFANVGAASTTDPRLSDARTPTAHNHTLSQITDAAVALNAKYDKSGGPITGSVTVNNNGTFRQDHTNAAAGNYAALFHVTSSQYAINKHTATGPAWIIVDPRPADGSSDALVQLFRNTNINPATGSAALRILLGNGSATVNTQLGGNGDSFLNASVGKVGFCTDSPQTQIDFNSDGIRIRQQRSPASSSSGFQGEQCFDDNYMYYRTSTGAWKRTPLQSY